MPKIRLILEYDGARFHGWQRQPGRRTVQGTLEAAIRRITREKVNVVGAGRTDAGVHALGQVAHFKTRSRMTAANWQKALNALLPDDMVVAATARAADRFHARFNARGKIYEYRLLNRRTPRAVGRGYVWHVYPPLDLDRMRRAARWLKGRHDFSAFRAGGKESADRSAVCCIRSIRLSRHGDEIRLVFRADRFLYQMIRTIVGTLVEVGRKKRTANEVRKILDSKDRGLAGQTAPAQGLFLVKVLY